MLRSKHPRWRDRTGAEQQGVVRETAQRPDIVIRPPGGIPVVLETEFEPARSVEEDARKRLGKFLQYQGAQIEQTIAVQIPQALSEVPQQDLEQAIAAAEFRYCTHALQAADRAVRWPATGWLVGTIDDLASCIENVSLSERLLAEGTQILEQSIGDASSELRETAGPHALEKMAQPAIWLVWGIQPLSLRVCYIGRILIRRTHRRPFVQGSWAKPEGVR